MSDYASNERRRETFASLRNLRGRDKRKNVRGTVRGREIGEAISSKKNNNIAVLLQTVLY